MRNLFFTSSYVTQDNKAFGTGIQETTNYSRYAGTNFVQDKIDALSVPPQRDTRYVYDSLGNLTSTTTLYLSAQAATTTMTYDAAHFYQVSTITDPLTHAPTQMFYDSSGNLIHTIDALKNSTFFTSNSYGQVLTKSYSVSLSPSGTSCGAGTSVTTTDTYNSIGNLTSVTTPLGNVTTYQYDGVGRRTGQIDAMKDNFTFGYDGNDAIVSVTDVFASQSSIYTRDANENITKYTDANTNDWTFIFDARNRQTKKCDPLNQCYVSGYDAVGNLTSVTTAGSQLSAYHYDELDRKTFDGYGTAPSWLRSVTYTYDLGDRLTQAVDSTSGTYTRGWDGNNRLTSETTPEGSVCYQYDLDGRRTSMAFTASGSCPSPQVSYVYNANNNVTSITQTGFGTASYAYDQHNQQCSLTLANGVSQAYSYDQDSRLTAIAYAKGSTNLGNLTYSYDASGRRTQVGGSFASVVLPTAFNLNGPFTYRTNNTVKFAWTSHTAMTYDHAGDDQGYNTLGYSDDVRDQLNQANLSGLTWTMMNDPFERRQRRIMTYPASTTTYLYDGTNVIQEQVQSVGTATVMVG